MRKRFLDLMILLLVAAAIALAAILVVHPSMPESPERIEVLRRIIAGQSVAYTPYPVGYLELAGHLIRAGGMRGLEMAQAAMYTLMVLLAYLTLSDLKVPRPWSLWGALAVAFFPTLMLSAVRFQDTCVSCFLMCVFAWLVVRLKRDGLSWMNTITGGAFFGASLLIRPNAVTLIPIALWAALRGRRFAAAQCTSLAVALALATAILAAVIVPAKGRFVVFDQYYAAYTLANGTHEHAFEGMLRDYNSEMRMSQSLHELGLPFAVLDRSDPVLAKEYREVAWSFIREYPLRYIGLETAKVLNLFRPDLRNVDHSFAPRRW
ncbi:MAG: glycosyltransferase family 39 protein [Acidobacteriia bacterium]|nr:glycosyltransferase family 39 protein [Terriglobia bacterium]